MLRNIAILLLSVISIEPRCSQANQETTRTQLVDFIKNDFPTLYERSVKNMALFKGVLKDIEILMDRDKQVATRATDFTNFIEKIEKLEEPIPLDKKHKLIMEWDKILIKNDVTLKEDPTVIDLLFDISLQKNGLETVLMNDFGDNLAQFEKDLNAKLDELWNSLPIEEQEKETKFNNWYKQYKKEKERKPKFIKVEELLKILQDSGEL